MNIHVIGTGVCRRGREGGGGRRGREYAGEGVEGGRRKRKNSGEENRGREYEGEREDEEREEDRKKMSVRGGIRARK